MKDEPNKDPVKVFRTAIRELKMRELKSAVDRLKKELMRRERARARA